MFTKGSQPPSDAPARKPEKARGRPAGGLPDPRSHAEPGSNRDLANENRHLERARIGRSGVRLIGVVPELLKGEGLEFGCEFS